MTTNRDRAAEIIAPWLEKEWGHPEDNAESAADALAAADVLAPDLPAPSLYAHGNQDKPMWDTGNYFRTDALDAPQVALSKAGDVWKMTPDRARELALALIAAAAHAQKDNNHE